MQHRKTSVNTAAGVSAASYRQHELSCAVARRNSRTDPCKRGSSQTKHDVPITKPRKLLRAVSLVTSYREALGSNVGRGRATQRVMLLSAVDIGRPVKRLKCFGAEERSSPLHTARTVSPTGLRSSPSTFFPNHH